MADKSIYQTHRPGNTDNLYLKLKDGDKVKLRLVSPPAVTTFDGEKLRYNWIVWNRAENKPQVYSSGISVFKQIADLVEEWGEPLDYDVTIKRTGSTMQDTEYNVTPVKTSEALTKAQLAEAEKIDLPQACKGKWLYEYERDGEMPPTIESSQPQLQQPDTVHDVDEDAPIDPSTIPF